MKALTVFGANGLVSRRSGTVTTFYAFDPLGNVADAVTGGGTRSDANYDAYGYPVGGGVAGPFGYKGQWGCYTDSESGLVLMGHRFYDTATGRFLTRDPMGYAGGINLYAYCRNNPVNLVDPSGFCPDSQPGDDDWNYEQDMERFRHHVPKLFATATLWGAKQMVNIGLMGVDGGGGDGGGGDGFGGEGGFGGGDGFGDGGGEGSFGGPTGGGPNGDLPEGDPNYFPLNDGFSSPPTQGTLGSGQVVARYGSPYGKFLTDPGSGPEQISLPPGNTGWDTGATLWQVPDGTSVNVLVGTAAPWFGLPGGSIQYVLSEPVINVLIPYVP